MPSVNFSLNLPPEEVELLYQGVQACQAITDAGIRVQFPAVELRPFIGHLGVQGRFSLHYSDTGKFESLVRISP